MATAKEIQPTNVKPELKNVSGESAGGVIANILKSPTNKSKHNDTSNEIKTGTTGKTQEEKEEEEKKKKKTGQEGGFLAKLFKNLFDIDSKQISQKETRDWAEQFAIKAKGNFKNYRSEKDFARDVVEAEKHDPKLANKAIAELYKAAKDKGFDTRVVEEQADVLRERQRLIPQAPTKATSENVTKIYREDNLSDFHAEAANRGKETLTPQERTKQEMTAHISSLLVHLDESNPLRVRAEKMLKDLADGTLHTLDQNQLQTLIAKETPLHAERFGEAEGGVAQALLTTAYRAAADNHMDTDAIRQNVTREVLNRMQDDLKRKDENELTEPHIKIYADRLDEGLQARRSADWKANVDTELEHAVGTESEVNDMRLNKAAAALEIPREKMSSELADAIIAAHNVGAERGATLGKYKWGEIREKYELLLGPLKKAFPNDTDIRGKIEKLMKKGIIGNGAVADTGVDLSAFTDEQRAALLRILPQARQQQHVNDGGTVDLSAFTDEQRAQLQRIRDAATPQQLLNDGTTAEDLPNARERALLAEIRRQRAARQQHPNDGAEPPEYNEGIAPLADDSQILREIEERDAEAARYNEERLSPQKRAEIEARRQSNAREEGKRFQNKLDAINYQRMLEGKEKLDLHPQDFKGVLRIIQISDPEKYGVGKPRELMNEDESVIHVENFMRWFYDRMDYLDGEAPDAQIQFFQQVGVELPALWRTVNVGNLLRTPTLFRYETDEIEMKDGKPVIDPQTKEPKKKVVDLKDLYNQVTNTVWLVGALRNSQVSFRTEVMLDENKNAENLVRLNASNDLVKYALGGKTTMEWIMTMAKDFHDKTNPNSKREDDMEMGAMIQETILMYYNISDYDFLQKQFGDLRYFMTKRGVDRALRQVIAGLDPLRPKTPEEVSKDDILAFKKRAKLTDIDSLFGADGKLDGSRDDHNKRTKVVDFIKIINPFEPFEKNPDQLLFARTLMRQAVAEQVGLLNADGVIEEKDSEIITFAEKMGYWFSYTHGAAQRQDTSQEAINTFSKYERVRQYKEKMLNYVRAGKSGNINTFTFLKSAIVDIITGMKSESKRTIHEDLLYMHNLRKKNRKEGIKDDSKQRERAHEMVYAQNAQKQLIDVQVKNGVHIGHNEFDGKSLNFKEWATYDAWGGVRLDAPKMQKDLASEWFTPSRYAFILGMNMDTIVKENVDKYNLEYRWATYADRTFNPEVLLTAQKMLKHEIKHRDVHHKDGLAKLRERWNNGKGDIDLDFLDDNGKVKLVEDPVTKDMVLPPKIKNLMADKEFNRFLQKAYLLCNFSAVLYGHTQWSSDAPHLEFGTRELILQALGKIPAQIGIDPNDKDFTKTKVEDYFFTAYDMKLMREKSHNNFWKGFFVTVGADGFGGGIEGFGKGLGFIFKHIFS